ncbi:MAG: anthranilate synthase component I family protein [Chitinophagales bacterium]
MAESTTVTLANAELFKQKAVVWANYFKVACLLDSNSYAYRNYSSIDWLLAVDAVSETEHTDTLSEWLKDTDQKIFGFLSYDYKNQLEKLTSNRIDKLQFPELYFFKPRYIFEIIENRITINRNYPETFELIELIERLPLPDTEKDISSNQEIELSPRTSKETYLQNVEKIKSQIEAGDFYELNYCNEFYNQNASVNPVHIFNLLNKKSKAPFSVFFKLNSKYLLCASPERFLRKNGSLIISEPIKGTIKKGTTKEENDIQKELLRTNEKERAENVMIVDLVRNDLARSSQPGSVKVQELCAVYEFNSVHQMISTVTAEIADGVLPIDVIRHAFPMGSMTGAPKVEVMKNIEQYEDFKRGLYSGCMGYFTPQNDFDFNVVIRSIFYESSTDYLSIRAGGAITYDSTAENEWNEMLLKTQSLTEVLHAKIVF